MSSGDHQTSLETLTTRQLWKTFACCCRMSKKRNRGIQSTGSDECDHWCLCGLFYQYISGVNVSFLRSQAIKKTFSQICFLYIFTSRHGANESNAQVFFSIMDVAKYFPNILKKLASSLICKKICTSLRNIKMFTFHCNFSCVL